MTRNCNFGLHSHSMSSHTDPLTGSQEITIFYNGRVCIWDMTELQARAIIWHARREMEQKIEDGAGSMQHNSTTLRPLQSLQFYGPPGVSMKRSLQRFLQRRNHRLQAASPYNH